MTVWIAETRPNKASGINPPPPAKFSVLDPAPPATVLVAKIAGVARIKSEPAAPPVRRSPGREESRLASKVTGALKAAALIVSGPVPEDT